jgi:hypothetical protein
MEGEMDYLFVYSVPELIEIKTDFKVDLFLVKFRSLKERRSWKFWEEKRKRHIN